MPSSATGIWTAEAGFTLLEVLVVLALLGIITGLALLRLPAVDDQSRLDREIRRLQRVMELQQEAAVLLGETRGIRFTEQGYTALRLTAPNQWRELDDDHTLPPGIQPRLSIEGQPLSLVGASPVPQVILWPDGAATVFRVALQSGGASSRLQGDLLGQLSTP